MIYSYFRRQKCQSETAVATTIIDGKGMTVVDRRTGGGRGERRVRGKSGGEKNLYSLKE